MNEQDAAAAAAEMVMGATTGVSVEQHEQHETEAGGQQQQELEQQVSEQQQQPEELGAPLLVSPQLGSSLPPPLPTTTTANNNSNSNSNGRPLFYVSVVFPRELPAVSLSSSARPPQHDVIKMLHLEILATMKELLKTSYFYKEHFDQVHYSLGSRTIIVCIGSCCGAESECSGFRRVTDLEFWV